MACKRMVVYDNPTMAGASFVMQASCLIEGVGKKASAN